MLITSQNFTKPIRKTNINSLIEIKTTINTTLTYLYDAANNQIN